MTIRSWAVSLAVISLCVASTGRAAEPAKGADEGKGPGIPLKRVVMFSSGVSFYERNGQVDGNAKVDLSFNVRDVNDLLKSMVVQDLGGGRISTVSYGSKDPITRTLRTFSIDLTANPTLADLLAQVRGEKIEVEAPDKISGTIIGVETREQPVDKEKTIHVSYVTILTDEGLRSVSLDRVGRIKLANPKLDADLRQALAVLALGKSVDKKTVSLNFLGNGKRQVRVGYIQESPVWKTSYRLVMEDKRPPLLQGWAIVENTSEEDWKDIGLTLISGRPISFIMDLYQPLYVDRPEVKQELYASLRPRTYDQDLASREADFRRAATGERLEEADKELAFKKMPAAKGAAAPAGPGQAGFGLAAEKGRYLKDEKSAGMRPGDSVQSLAQASDVGEMFEYSISTPVTIERQRSAMLPIVNDSVQGEKVSIYNPSVHAKHPLNGLRLKNTTELHLMQGPITVFDDGAYAGDAQITDLPPKSERLISYAMDLDTEVAPTSKGLPEEMLSVRLAKGTLFVTRKYGRTQSYLVKNSGKREKKVLVEYPLDTSWTLIAPAAPAEKTRDMYRFAVDAQPGKPSTLDITEQRTAEEQLAVTNLDDNAVKFFLSAKVVSDPVKAALAEVIKRKVALGQVVARRQELERQVQVIFQEQERIRQNMAQLPKDSDLFRRYVMKFNEQEDAVEKLRGEVQKSIAEGETQRKSLDEYLLSLNLT